MGDKIKCIDSNEVDKEGNISKILLFGKPISIPNYITFYKKINDINIFIVERKSKMSEITTGNREIYSCFDCKIDENEIIRHKEGINKYIKLNIFTIMFINKILYDHLNDVNMDEDNKNLLQFNIESFINQLKPDYSDNCIEKSKYLNVKNNHLNLFNPKYIHLNILNPVIKTI